jgi:hypothetical protein
MRGSWGSSVTIVITIRAGRTRDQSSFPSRARDFSDILNIRTGYGPTKAQSSGFKGIKRLKLKVSYSPPPISEVQNY